MNFLRLALVLLACVSVETAFVLGEQGFFKGRLFQRRKPVNNNVIINQVDNSKADLGRLLEGVKKISSPGTPGYLSVFGPDSLILAYGVAGENLHMPAVATGKIGKGKMVAFGHEGYLGDIPTIQEWDTARLINNCIKWLAPTGDSKKLLHIGNERTINGLSSLGYELEKADLDNLDPSRVLVIQEGGLSPEKVDKVISFVRHGGGFITSSTGWGWLQLNPGKTLLMDHGANLVLAKGGLVFGKGYLEDSTENGFLPNHETKPAFHATKALEIAKTVAYGTKSFANAMEERTVSENLRIALHEIPANDEYLLPNLKYFLKNAPKDFLEQFPDFKAISDQLKN